MRISSPLPTTTLSAQRTGRALQAGVSQSASVKTGDVLELSGLGQIASSLGVEGLNALKTLGQGGISEERLLAFVQSLSQQGVQDESAGSVLAKITSMSSLLGEGGEKDLFTAIESRGISGDLKYLDSLDNLFNVGSRDVAGIFNAGSEMSDEEFNVFIKSVTDLLKAGVVGTRTVEWRGQPTQIFIETEIGSDLSRARPYRRKFPV
jgi:hypothetical protein